MTEVRPVSGMCRRHLFGEIVPPTTDSREVMGEWSTDECVGTRELSLLLVSTADPLWEGCRIESGGWGDVSWITWYLI